MRALALACFLFAAVSASAATVPLRQTSNLAIDCSGYNQPCTGTTCIHQQRTEYCGTAEFQCQNDAQQYTGGNKICCTGKNECYACGVTRPDGSIRIYKIWSYNGVTTYNCTANP